MATDQKTTSVRPQRPSDGVAAKPSGRQCGCCDSINENDAKFCARCGQSLLETCAKCHEQVAKSQRFCNACGEDLIAVLDRKNQKLQAMVAEAIANAKQNEYDSAITTLRQVTRTDDYRLAEVIDQASKALARITELRDQANANVKRIESKANQAAEANDHQRVVSLLDSIPDHLISDEAKRLRRQSHSTVKQHVELNATLQAAMKQRDWLTLGCTINQLLVLAPENKNYQQVAAKVAGRLFALAQHSFQRDQYDTASDQLDAIPDCQQSAETDKLGRKIAAVRWMRSAIKREPLATTAIGRLAIRLAKERPTGPNQARAKALVDRIKQTPQGRNGRNIWKADPACWIGGQVGLLARFNRIDSSDAFDQQLLKHPSRWNVAIGLAIQGLGEARITESLAKGKKGFLKSLSRRKATTAWGVDIGATGIRAVRMAKTDTGIEFKELYNEPFSAVSRRWDSSDDADGQAQAQVVAAIEKFVQTHGGTTKETPVWINVPGYQVVNRTVRLPPLPDKLALEQLDRETKTLFPIDASELSVVRWTAPLLDDETKGRPSMIAAARTSVIEKRLSVFDDTGLTVAGVQSDPIALCNLVAYEFADQWTGEADDESNKAIALFDSGAVATSVIVVSDRAAIIGTIDSGGDDLTKIVARQTKTALADAQSIKHDPASIPLPDQVFEALEPNLQSLRQRLQRHFDASQNEPDAPNVTQTWISGDNSRCLGWVRQVLGA